jgi:Holliday junction resolvase RusA-like endonuclease
MTTTQRHAIFTVTIPGNPVPWSAPTVTRRGGFSAPKMRRWSRSAVVLIRAAWGGRPAIDGPAILRIVAVKARPKRLLRRKDPDGRIPCPDWPDATNIQKLTEDAVQAAGVVTDDKRFVAVSTWTLYAAKGEEPSVQILVEEWVK